VNNSAGTSTGDYGGGLYLNIPSKGVIVENNVWLNNQAGGEGAAIYFLDYSTIFDSIRHNTIAGNGTPESVALYLYSILLNGSSLRVENNIITGYAVGVMREFAGKLETKNNLYFDNAVNELGATVLTDSIKADPLFRNPVGHDVRLRAGSPAIDSAADLGVLVDRNGVKRPQGAGIDIGAYEYTPNQRPTATDDEYAAFQNTPLEIPVPGVLGNDEDQDGDPLVAVVESQPAHGTLTLNADGSFSYVPEAGFSGNDSFTYRADDFADLSELATVTIAVQPGGAPSYRLLLPVVSTP
jgi:VCBS repeat-containing protein